MAPDIVPPARRSRGLAAVRVVVAVLLTLVVAVVVDGFVLVHRIPTVAVPDTRQGEGAAYLLVGSDSRERLEGEDAAVYLDAVQASGERADVLMLLLDPVDGPPSLLNIPRDLWVRPAQADAYRLGISMDRGPAVLVDNLCRDVGIGVDHLVIIDFRGLIDVVEAMGGVQISPELPTRDAEAGLSLATSGPQRVGGRDALAWVRSRDAEVLRGGHWVMAPWDPYVRTGHAVDVVRQVAAGVDDPITLQRVAWSAGPHVRRDEALGPRGLPALGRSLREALSANRISTVPVQLTQTQVPIGFPTEGTDEALAPFRSAGCGP